MQKENLSASGALEKLKEGNFKYLKLNNALRRRVFGKAYIYKQERSKA